MECCDSGTLMKNLTEDVVMEIFCRLPVKSLLKFRCVCKAWSALIKSHHFIEMHLRSRPTKHNQHVLLKRHILDELKNPFSWRSVLSFHSHEDEESFHVVAPHLDLPDFNPRDVHLIGPCNGIVCLSDYDDFCLCNPATREFKILPPNPFGYPESYRSLTDAFGFGYDLSNNDYKVIRILYWVPYDFKIILSQQFVDPRCRAELYSLSTNSWRLIGDALPWSFYYSQTFALFFHGSFHWRGSIDSYPCIVSFNMTREVFGMIRLPDCIGPNSLVDGTSESLVTLDDSLALVLFKAPWPEISEQFIDIWVMMEYGTKGSWVKKFSLGPLSGIFTPLCSWNNDKLLLEDNSGWLVSCPLVDNPEIKRYDFHGLRSGTAAVVWMESLVLLNGRTEH